MQNAAHQLPLGFQTAGITCGIKASGLPDLAVFVSAVPATGVGVFTQNQVVGAPVQLSRKRVPAVDVRGVVLNSGNANACTGERGLQDAHQMTAQLAQSLGVAAEQVLVCSTGVIGHFLPMEVIEAGIARAAGETGNSSAHLQAAAKAMMTTDTVEKIASRQFPLEEKTVCITGVAKGAAMIAPNMATMLCVIMTDIAIDPVMAAEMLKQAVDRSFNCISVDGHMSTSDTVLLLANGAAETGCTTVESREAFQQQLNAVCTELAQAIIQDAEGAEHFVTVHVRGLSTHLAARQIARSVCESPLVKTAIAGNDPNWGRIVSAAGYAGVPFTEQEVSLTLNDVLIYDHGRPTGYDEAALSQSMQTGDVRIELEFSSGACEVTCWTCDLTAEYVRLNADYTT